jgi:catechol 2,3-dioxygenase-like lactoylglutathione lyase family enzyme
MFSHVTLGSNDLDAAARFYEPVMAALGHRLLFRTPSTQCYGSSLTEPKLFLMTPFDGRAASVGNGSHCAFIVTERAAVDAFHAVALAHGGSDEGPPGPRPHYHPNYYGAYVRDPDGNKLQAVCHRAERGS